MMFGAVIFAGQFAFLVRNILRWFDFGPATLPLFIGTTAWSMFAALSAGAVLLFRLLDRWKRR